MIFVVMYAIYVTIMYFNPRLGDYFIGKVANWKSKREKDADDTLNNKDAEKQPLLGENPKMKSGSYESSGSGEIRKQSLDPSDGGPLVSSQEAGQKDNQRRVGAVVPPANGVSYPTNRRRSAESDIRESYQHSGFIRSHSALQPEG